MCRRLARLPLLLLCAKSGFGPPLRAVTVTAEGPEPRGETPPRRPPRCFCAWPLEQGLGRLSGVRCARFHPHPGDHRPRTPGGSRSSAVPRGHVPEREAPAPGVLRGFSQNRVWRLAAGLGDGGAAVCGSGWFTAPEGGVGGPDRATVSNCITQLWPCLPSQWPAKPSR